jgi:hypothetical protein
MILSLRVNSPNPWHRPAVLFAVIALCACTEAACNDATDATAEATGAAGMQAEQAPEGQCWSSVPSRGGVIELRRPLRVDEVCVNQMSLETLERQSLALGRAQNPDEISARVEATLADLAPSNAEPRQVHQLPSTAPIRLEWIVAGSLRINTFSLALVEQVGEGVYRARTAANAFWGEPSRAAAFRDRFATAPMVPGMGVRVIVGEEPTAVTRSTIRYNERYWTVDDGVADLAFDQIDFTFRIHQGLSAPPPAVCASVPEIGATVSLVGYDTLDNRLTVDARVGEVLLYPIGSSQHARVLTLLGDEGMRIQFEGMQGGAVLDTTGCLVGTVSQITQTSSDRMVFYSVGYVGEAEEQAYFASEVEQGWVRSIYLPIIGR